MVYQHPVLNQSLKSVKIVLTSDSIKIYIYITNFCWFVCVFIRQKYKSKRLFFIVFFIFSSIRKKKQKNSIWFHSAMTHRFFFFFSSLVIRTEYAMLCNSLRMYLFLCWITTKQLILDSLKMKSIIVTGANRGIGYGLVKQLLVSKTEHVFATYRQVDRSKVMKIWSIDSHRSTNESLKELLELAKQNSSRLVPIQLGSLIIVLKFSLTTVRLVLFSSYE